MNKHAENQKSKGISREGFWRQLKDKTAKKHGGTDSIDAHNLPEPNSEPNDDWEARFDEWLNRL